MFLVRPKKVKFYLEKINSNKAILYSDYGIFTIDGLDRIIRCQISNGKTFAYKFEEIKGIKYSFDETFSVARLSLFDKKITFLISLVLLNQKRDNLEIPLFVVKQTLLWDWFSIWSSISINILSAFSLYKDSETYSREVLDNIISIFKFMGKEIKLLT